MTGGEWTCAGPGGRAIIKTAQRRSVAQPGRAAVSKTAGRGFESLHSCPAGPVQTGLFLWPEAGEAGHHRGVSGSKRGQRRSPITVIGGLGTATRIPPGRPNRPGRRSGLPPHRQALLRHECRPRLLRSGSGRQASGSQLPRRQSSGWSQGHGVGTEWRKAAPGAEFPGRGGQAAATGSHAVNIPGQNFWKADSQAFLIPDFLETGNRERMSVCF